MLLFIFSVWSTSVHRVRSRFSAPQIETRRFRPVGKLRRENDRRKNPVQKRRETRGERLAAGVIFLNRWQEKSGPRERERCMYVYTYIRRDRAYGRFNGGKTNGYPRTVRKSSVQRAWIHSRFIRGRYIPLPAEFPGWRGRPRYAPRAEFTGGNHFQRCTREDGPPASETKDERGKTERERKRRKKRKSQPRIWLTSRLYPARSTRATGEVAEKKR